MRKFELYDTWFDDNSTVSLPQTGVYQGADDIKEYMKFIFVSPYISANGLLHDESGLLNFDEEKRSCVFLVLIHRRFQMSEMGGNALFEAALFYKVEWRFDEQKVGRMGVFCKLPSSLREFCGPRPTAQPRATEGAAVVLCADPASLAVVQMPRISPSALSLPSRRLAPTNSSAG